MNLSVFAVGAKPEFQFLENQIHVSRQAAKVRKDAKKVRIISDRIEFPTRNHFFAHSPCAAVFLDNLVVDITGQLSENAS